MVHVEVLPGLGLQLHQALEPLVGRRFETEEDIEFARDRPPRVQQLCVPGDDTTRL